MQYSPFESKTNKCFKAYLHYPACSTFKDKKVKFCITYRLLTFRDKIKTITFFYDNNNSLIGAVKAKKQISAINLLKSISSIIIKELQLFDQIISTPKYGTKSDNNWVYGVPINEDFFKKVSLCGEVKDIIRVGERREPFKDVTPLLENGEMLVNPI